MAISGQANNTNNNPAKIPEIIYNQKNLFLPTNFSIKLPIKNKEIIFACGTCLKSRSPLEPDMCPISTMIDYVNMVEWADKGVSI